MIAACCLFTASIRTQYKRNSTNQELFNKKYGTDSIATNSNWILHTIIRRRLLFFFLFFFQIVEHYIYDISNKNLFTHNAHIILCVVLSSAYGYIMSSVRSGVHISTEISINSD